MVLSVSSIYISFVNTSKLSQNCNKMRLFSFTLLLMPMLFHCATSDAAKDKEECTEQLVGLATCLPYVGGNAKSPTPDCCSGLKQLLNTNKKCLCVIIKDRNDPDLGISINVTIALGLPSVCHAPANVSQCPALLHLPPNSSDAQVFYQFGHGTNASAPVASVKANTTIDNSNGTSATQKSESAKRWMGWEVIFGGVLLWCFTSKLFI